MGQTVYSVIHLFGLVLEEGDKVTAVLLLLQSSKRHFGSRNVLLGVLEVLEHCLFVPMHGLLDVGLSVCEAISLARLTSKDSVKIGSNFVGLASGEGMALSAPCLEETGTLLSITWCEWHCVNVEGDGKGRCIQEV